MRLVPIAASLLVSAAAHADVGLRVVDDEMPIVDGGVWGDQGGIPNAAVRIVGDTVVVLAHTNAYGQFSIAGLAHGIYRVETDRGHLIELVHLDGPITLDQPRRVCDVDRLSRRRYEGVLGAVTPPPLAGPAPTPTPRARTAAPGRGHVDTTSTTQGIRITPTAL